jgi:uncharacterized membrane protein
MGMTKQTEPDGENCARNSARNSARTWTFRGYRLDQANFITAMVHFYRGEMGRANTWRTRLDVTTNWAVVTVAAALTFVFGGSGNPHFVLLLVLLLLFVFLMIEARRYRYYALWAFRVHLMETDFFASIFTPPFRPSSDWANLMAESLNHPTFPVTLWEAVSKRFYRNYIWLITLLLISWTIKLSIHPTPALEGVTIIERAAVGIIPGAWVMAIIGAVYGALMLLAAAVSLPRSWREALSRRLRCVSREPRRADGPLMPMSRPRERLVTIITDRGEAVAARLMEELGRGVTALKGIGMYTGETLDVLLCAVTEVQVSHLEEIVCQVDPEAFAVVNLAEEVRGGGFRPFEPPS